MFLLLLLIEVVSDAKVSEQKQKSGNCGKNDYSIRRIMSLVVVVVLQVDVILR